jgi:bacillithiol biosynthesis deacetylase BshB1
MDNYPKLDILAFGAHPDDVELSAAGTLLKHIDLGKSVGIIDLTEGELGTRGTAQTRYIEAAHASDILGLTIRKNLQMPDGFFEHDEFNIRKIVEVLRMYRPTVVLCNAVHDRHPDHARAAKLVSDACFMSGLRKVETLAEGIIQEPHRPKTVYHYIQDRFIKPDFVVDVSPYVHKKMAAIRAYTTQFYDPQSIEPDTPISGKEFMDFIHANMQVHGRSIGVPFAEGFTTERCMGVRSFFDLI